MSDAPLADAPRRAEAGHRGALRSLSAVETEAERDGPMIVHAVSLTVSGGRASASVEVRRDGEQSVGVAEGPCAGGAIDRLVAEATVQAVAGIVPDAALVAIDAISVTPAGPRTVVTVVLARAVVVGDEPSVGVAAVGPGGVADAVAHAVVDALARRSPSA